MKAPYANEQTSNKQKTVIIAGATGYIGRAVVQESVRQGYNTVALVRDQTKYQEQSSFLQKYFQGASIVQCDVTNEQQVKAVFQDIVCENKRRDDVIVVSCLASRSGVKKDAYKIDYQASLYCLLAGKAIQAKQYILLSAFCVQKPKLHFQHAKLKLEAAIVKQKQEAAEIQPNTENAGMTYTIVRPTAFFKSLSGKLDNLLAGSPYVLFGNGELTKCNPIAESDLAQYMLDSINDKNRHNQILNIGGPGEPLTNKQQAMLLSNIVKKEPKFLYIPVAVLDFIINSFQWLATITGSEKLEDGAEIARIIKYYAVEDMLTTEPNEIYGTITLEDHYQRIAVEGQEFDPYVAIYSRPKQTSIPTIQNSPETSVTSSPATSSTKQATVDV